METVHVVWLFVCVSSQSIKPSWSGEIVSRSPSSFTKFSQKLHLTLHQAVWVCLPVTLCWKPYLKPVLLERSNGLVSWRLLLSTNLMLQVATGERTLTGGTYTNLSAPSAYTWVGDSLPSFCVSPLSLQAWLVSSTHPSPSTVCGSTRLATRVPKNFIYCLMKLSPVWIEGPPGSVPAFVHWEVCFNLELCEALSSTCVH